jgi:glucosylceramidase
MPRRIFCLSVLSLAAALSCAVAPRATVEVTVTTGDRAKLLSREADVYFDESPLGGVPTIDVDPTRTYQKMVGFGAALSDASAWLIQNKLTPAQRESLLHELFGREPGIGFSFVRLDMGASDFSLRHYSYDDVNPGEFDSTLANFSIAADRDATLPILKRALAINPQLTVMASPWSAPAWMKTTGSLIKGTLRPDAYALRNTSASLSKHIRPRAYRSTRSRCRTSRTSSQRTIPACD